jgi:hypothetical protein
MAFAVNFKKITACNKGFAGLLAGWHTVCGYAARDCGCSSNQMHPAAVLFRRAHSQKNDGEKRLAFESELESKLSHSDDNIGERIS